LNRRAKFFKSRPKFFLEEPNFAKAEESFVKIEAKKKILLKSALLKEQEGRTHFKKKS
jgi:hypothetical protein